MQVSIFRTELQPLALACSSEPRSVRNPHAPLSISCAARGPGALLFVFQVGTKWGSQHSDMHRATRPQHIPGAPRSISAASAGSFEHNSSPSTCVRHMPALIFPGGRICVESMHVCTSQSKHNFSGTRLNTDRTSSPDCRDRLS